MGKETRRIGKRQRVSRTDLEGHARGNTEEAFPRTLEQVHRDAHGEATRHRSCPTRRVSSGNLARPATPSLHSIGIVWIENNVNQRARASTFPRHVGEIEVRGCVLRVLCVRSVVLGVRLQMKGDISHMVDVVRRTLVVIDECTEVEETSNDVYLLSIKL
ncbi:hypothetical protein EXIGLDRAFT_135619 [Exidia glandulosa HHB12029]|uniref:Uncharacterized protein n=1 Tax=Exidia glandulosa HHB12029 TaxID=1314781 RepID=A0A165NGF6_EXIGL|nr:hypothetical protein EXIGLDRAFT_135619 [Exidia glandulosa HHB12029]